MPVNDKARLTFEEANNLLRYEPETGLIYWRVSKGATKAGNVAGNKSKDGYSINITIDGISYQNQTLAWLLYYGRYSNDCIYHVNKNKKDNKIDNLRECSNDEYRKIINLEKLQEITEKTCTNCRMLKPIERFSVKSIKRALISSECKDCEKAKRDAIRQTPEWKEKHRKWGRDRLKRLVESGEYKIIKRVEGYRKRGIDKDKAMKLALQGPQRKYQAWKKHPDDFTYHDDIVRQNALQAWRYWFTVKASKEWLDGYYERQPWKDHRIPASDAFKLRYKHDPEFCIQQRMRAHMRRQKKKDKIGDIMRCALKANGKSNAVERLLGYTVAELREHLEKQFTKRMNWKRFADGDIHIDHIIPISAFNFENVGDPEWKACWALTNLRPLWAKDNLLKSGKIVSLL
jgi:hypothetical protein